MSDWLEKSYLLNVSLLVVSVKWLVLTPALQLEFRQTAKTPPETEWWRRAGLLRGGLGLVVVPPQTIAWAPYAPNRLTAGCNSSARGSRAVGTSLSSKTALWR